MTFKAVFDAANHADFGALMLPVGSLFAAAIGAMMLFYPARLQRIMPKVPNGPTGTAFKWVFLLFGLAFAIGTSALFYTQKQSVSADLRDGRFAVVEGPVRNFVAETAQSKRESFDVGDRHFWYSAGLITPGFRGAYWDGGPMRDGLYVRISYQSNLILRLDVAN